MTSLLLSVTDLLFPRLCAGCGNRLAATEQTLCAACNLHLPRTNLWLTPADNVMARCFWGHFPIDRAAAYVHYGQQNLSSHLVADMKYYGNDKLCEQVGTLMAREMAASGFFEGMDVIVPVPLAKKRQRQRGYNQSLSMARGVAAVTRLPIADHAVERRTFVRSQTHLTREERRINVQDAFAPCTSTWYRKADDVAGRHVLLIDDIMTTGATLTACAEALMQCRPSAVSILTFGLTSNS